jgi:hypothetical protein
MREERIHHAQTAIEKRVFREEFAEPTAATFEVEPICYHLTMTGRVHLKGREVELEIDAKTLNGTHVQSVTTKEEWAEVLRRMADNLERVIFK